MLTEIEPIPTSADYNKKKPRLKFQYRKEKQTTKKADG